MNEGEGLHKWWGETGGLRQEVGMRLRAQTGSGDEAEGL